MFRFYYTSPAVLFIQTSLVEQLMKRRSKLLGRHRSEFGRKNNHDYVVHAMELWQLVTDNFVYAPAHLVSAGSAFKDLFANNDSKPRFFTVRVAGVFYGDKMRPNCLAVLVNVPQTAVTMEPKSIR
jgi:hypothetical protein